MWLSNQQAEHVPVYVPGKHRHTCATRSGAAMEAAILATWWAA